MRKHQSGIKAASIKHLIGDQSEDSNSNSNIKEQHLIVSIMTISYLNPIHTGG